MAISRLSLLILMASVFLASIAGGANAQEAQGVLATYNLYNPERINWDMRTASTFCATWDADMPLEWRKHYGWTAFCGPAGAHGQPSCGRCILVYMIACITLSLVITRTEHNKGFVEHACR
jgi:hypothetical protein